MIDAPDYDEGADLLACLVAAFEAVGAPFDRAYTSDGSVAFDWSENGNDSLLAVEWERSEPIAVNPLADPGTMSFGWLKLKNFWRIHAARVTPWPAEAGDPPEPEEIEESSQRIHADRRIVLNAILTGAYRGALFQQESRVEFVFQNAMGPDGGIVGSVTEISVVL